MLEVEVKVRLGPGDAERLRERLRRAGAQRGKLEVQQDTYFAHPQRDFARTDEALRLRTTSATSAVLELTYKGPRDPGSAAKSRREETVHVRDDPTPVLEALGFRPAAQVRKRRESWQLPGVSVAIDEVDGLGAFVEVEAMAEDAAEGGRRVDAALQGLGLEKGLRVAASYLEMLHR